MISTGRKNRFVVQEPDVLRVNLREDVLTACTGDVVIQNSP
jgi:hypothetical protein